MADWVSVKLFPSRALCGTTPEEFGDLVVRLAPHVEAQRAARLDRPGRLRAPGAGRKPVPFRVRLLCALTHLRLGISVRATASMFGVDEKSVRNWRNELEAVLVAHGVVVAGRAAPVRTLDEFGDYLKERAAQSDPDDPDSQFYVVVDGTDIARPRPGDWASQRPAWSGKSHKHAVKGTLVCDPDGNPLWFEANPSGEGRTQDITMLRSGALLAALSMSAVAVLGDLGYLGLDRDLPDNDVYVPRRRRPNRPRLDRDDRLYNHALAKARIRVEHAIARTKRWGALRQHRRHPDRLDQLGRAIVVLDSITS
jgi:hypothetical protein